MDDRSGVVVAKEVAVVPREYWNKALVPDHEAYEAVHPHWRYMETFVDRIVGDDKRARSPVAAWRRKMSDRSTVDDEAGCERLRR